MTLFWLSLLPFVVLFVLLIPAQVVTKDRKRRIPRAQFEHLLVDSIQSGQHAYQATSLRDQRGGIVKLRRDLWRVEQR